MSTILLGTRIHSILYHWEGLAGPAPCVPGYTVALASIYASKITPNFILISLLATRRSFWFECGFMAINRSLRASLVQLIIELLGCGPICSGTPRHFENSFVWKRAGSTQVASSIFVLLFTTVRSEKLPTMKPIHEPDGHLGRCSC